MRRLRTVVSEPRRQALARFMRHHADA